MFHLQTAEHAGVADRLDAQLTRRLVVGGHMHIDSSAGGSHEGDVRVAGHLVLGGLAALAVRLQLRLESDDHRIAKAIEPLGTPEVGQSVVGDGGGGSRGECGRLCDDLAFRYAVGIHVLVVRGGGAEPDTRPFAAARRAEPPAV